MSYSINIASWSLVSTIPLFLACDSRTWIAAEPAKRTEYEIVDTSRVTPALGPQPEIPERVLRFLMWEGEYTGYGEDRPLLFLAHGGGGAPEGYDDLATHVTNQGYVAVSLAFPLTNENAYDNGITGVTDVPNQPADVSFVLDWLIAAAQDSEHQLYGRFSTENLAYLGHSLGAQTGLALNRYDCCTDTRFDAWIFVSSMVLFNDMFFPENELPVPSEGPPVVLIHGYDDSVAPIEGSQEIYQTISGSKAFVGLYDTDHYEVVDNSEPAATARMITQDLVVATLQDWVQGESGRLAETLQSIKDAGEDVQWEF